MDATIVGLAPTIARTTFYVASAIVLAGLVSGLVMLGLLQLYARERIQRVALFHFFQAPDHENGFWRSGLVMIGLSGREASAKEAAWLLGMPERALCRLYYRQISGQFLAAANAEAARSEQESGAKPLLTALVGRSPAHPPTPSDLEAASRSIDVLQVRLGDAVAKAAMAAMVVSWSLFFLVVGMLTSLESYERLRDAGSLGPGLLPFLSFWLPSAAAAAVGALALALCASACGLVALNWLDRALAVR